MLTKRKKQNAIQGAKIHDTDSGSPEVQVSLLTKRIEELTTHLKKNKKDNHSRRGLLSMVAKRRAHLQYLLKKDPGRHEAILKRLKLKGNKESGIRN